MKKRLTRAALAALFVGSPILPFVGSPTMAAEAPKAAAPGSVVRFPSQDRDLTGGTPTMLEGRLLLPNRAHRSPAVVLLHGCAGLYRQDGVTVGERDRAMAERLRGQGYVVLMVDSFTPRGVREVCHAARPAVRPDVERKRDAHAALDYLRSRPDVIGDRIGLLGWSNGGSTVLGAQGLAPVAGYRAAVAYYPGCRRSADNPHWRLKAPLLVLSGASDDWTPASHCQKLAAGDGAAGLFEFVLYPNAHHNFDAPDMPLKELTNIPNVKRGAVTIGSEPTARADSIERAGAFLARWLKD